MRVVVIVLFLALLQGVRLNVGQTFNPDAICGYWLTKDSKARVQIWRSGKLYYGKIVNLKDPKETDGSPRLDKHNPNENLRKRPVAGLPILKNFEYIQDENDYENGTIYDPESGSTYSCYIVFGDNSNVLKLRGYIGISLIGRTEYWTRTR